MEQPLSNTQQARASVLKTGAELPASQHEAAVALSHVSVRLGGHDILHDVNLTVPQGSFFGILGPNGAGKTTLYHTILGGISPVSGEVRVLGAAPYPRNAALLRQVGIQPQRAAFFKDVTVQDHLRIICRIFGAPVSNIEEFVEPFHLTKLLKRKVDKLSGGERQRVSLVSALVHHPRLVCLDEPMAAVDAKARHELVSMLHSTQLRGITTLYTTHNLDEAEQLCDSIAILDHGTVTRIGTPQELIAAAQTGVTIILPQAAGQLELAQREFGAPQVSVAADGLHISGADAAELFARAYAIKLDTAYSKVEGGRLEDAFLTITNQDASQDTVQNTAHNAAASSKREESE